MTEEEIIRTNMLIHGHDTSVDLLKLDSKLVDLAVLLAINEDYENTGFQIDNVRLSVALKESKVFLKEKFVLHKIPYATDFILKLKLFGRKISEDKDLIKLYNGIGKDIDPFKLPVKLVSEPYYYGNVALLANLSENEEYLKGMRLFFQRIDLGKRTCSMTSVCYVHEIVHTQLESLKGIVEKYYNSELLSIFLEFVYAYNTNEILLSECLKNRINLFLGEFDSLSNYLLGTDTNSGKWHNIVAGKYIVSTVKAFNLFYKYYFGSDNMKKYIIESVQNVFDGKYTLEEMLRILDITYENSLDYQQVLRLIKR